MPSSRNQVLSIIGLRQNNLKNLSLEIPHNKFVAISGVSGSGKSTLAFDSIYAEGGRRYLETFSPYTRQFLDRLEQPDHDAMHGVRPALALEQRNKTTNARSTVGTVTEINDYLKIIWANLASLHCPDCKQLIESESAEQILKKLEALIANSKITSVCPGFALELSEKVDCSALAEILQSQGFVRFFSDLENKIKRISEIKSADLHESLFVVVDRISLAEAEISHENKKRLIHSLNQCYHCGKNKLQVLLEDDAGKFVKKSFSKKLSCKNCGFSTPAPRPALFSFNSPLGACVHCNGFGNTLEVDLDLCIANPNLSLANGAISIWQTPATKRERTRLFKFCDEFSIDASKPWSKLSSKEQGLVINGAKNTSRFRGILPWFKMLKKKIYKMHVRVFLARYRKETTCEKCRGSRLNPLALSFKIRNKSLSDLWQMNVAEVLFWFKEVAQFFKNDVLHELAFKEVESRLQYLEQIGLSYLQLSRQTRTLSGGEAQRVSLTSILGSRLTNTSIVLDEPTIGLHAQDSQRLLESFYTLRDRGNSIIVVEHDPEILLAADHLIDLGPGAGSSGGQIVFSGDPQEIVKEQSSLTGKYLSQDLVFKKAAIENSSDPQQKILIRGAKANNLKNFDLEIPLGQLVVLCGVSGSGKSTLVEECLLKPYQKLRQGLTDEQLEKNCKDSLAGLKNYNSIQDIVLIDQSPVGKTPRSNPATYTKAWDVIRECLAESEAAKKLGLSKSSFSFNVDGGRCPTCKGAGQEKIEMQFLADAYIECEACRGKRFQEQVLLVEYSGKSVSDFLELSLDDCYQFFLKKGEDKRAEQVLSCIKPLVDLGLGYMRLGQTLNTVSGGEAQRIKLASYLKEENKGRYLFVLDEPTTGLHPHNIEQLLNCFDQLSKKGHSILVIEHNLDLISRADYLIELGPGAGKDGGEKLVEGFLKNLLKDKSALKKSNTLSLLKKKNSFSANNKKLKAREQAKFIEISGARHHNLKNIELRIPHNKLNVITGVSGSGKSTLAFDIIFAEGQRRYIESLSPYARQYIKQLERADVDYLSDIPPTIALSQRTTTTHGISTIASTTEIYQYLRLLFTKVGIQHCPKHNIPISNFSRDGLVQILLERYQNKRIHIFAPVVSGRKGHYAELFQKALAAEIEKARIDGEMQTIFENLRLERHKLHDISLLVASINVNQKTKNMLELAVEQALVLSGSEIEVSEESPANRAETFSLQRMCPKCSRGFLALDPQDFSFSSRRGACEKCSGKGLIVGDKICPACAGARIKEIARNVFIDGKTIHELSSLKSKELLDFISRLKFEDRLLPVVQPILKELTARLKMIISIGLDYLSLDRDSSSLSGGEAQRLRLARSLGSPLTGACYVLDEPSIGLHASDHAQLMQTLFDLRDRGNTLIVVEHDEETIREAEHLIDMGPAGGSQGGAIIAQGTLSELLSSQESKTADSLNNRKKAVLRKIKSESSSTAYLELYGASANNLKNQNASFLLDKLNVVIGVSGAGKSSLLHKSLVPAIISKLEGSKSKASTWKELKNYEKFERYVEIDQSPLGKTSSSTPASFLGIFDEIRKSYALSSEAEVLGFSASHFSFNSGKGRCETCGGRGEIRIPMSFLPEARSICEACRGLRYNEETLEVKYLGLSIAELLQKTISEVREIFKHHKKIKRSLDYVEELGLGYISLGQTSSSLSGGEAQRLKIARELGLREASNTLYLLDEPSVGLHMSDVDKLISVLKKLSEKQNTVVIIEHNLDIIREADYLLELGPGPAENGGQIIFKGTPWELKNSKINTATKIFI